MTADFLKWYRMAKDADCLSGEEMTLAEWAIGNMNAFGGEKAVPVNRDFTPGNWLVRTDGTFAGIIDFECMEWGIPVDSFCMLWSRYFPGYPDGEKAFWEGYGTAPDPVQARIARIKVEMANVGYGAAHSIAGLVESGRTMLRTIADQG